MDVNPSRKPEMTPAHYRCSYAGCSARRSSKPYMHQKLYNVKRHVWNTHCRSDYLPPYNAQYESLKKLNLITQEMELEIKSYVAKCADGLVATAPPRRVRPAPRPEALRVAPRRKSAQRAKSARARPDEDVDAAPPAKRGRTEPRFESPISHAVFTPFEALARDDLFYDDVPAVPGTEEDVRMEDVHPWLMAEVPESPDSPPESPSLSPDYSFTAPLSPEYAFGLPGDADPFFALALTG